MPSQYLSAKQMALQPHNLSRDGMSATLPSGDVYKWSNHFNVWAGPFPWSKGDAKAPRAAA
jgi:hypothetical protein